MMLASGYRVISFEPVPTTFAALADAADRTKSLMQQEGRWTTESSLTLLNKAASTEAGKTVIFSAPGNSGHSVSVHTGGEDATRRAHGEKSKLIKSEIALTTLDATVSEYVDVMKIDVEGHELKALLGAKRLFDEYGVGVVFLEWNPRAVAALGGLPMTILQFFQERGYWIFPGQSQEDFKNPVQQRDFEEFVKHFRPIQMWWTDLVFIKKTSKHLPTQPSEFTYSSRARCRYVKNPNDKECSEYKAAKAASSGASTAVGKVAGKAVSKVAGKAVGKVAGKAAVSKAKAKANPEVVVAAAAATRKREMKELSLAQKLRVKWLNARFGVLVSVLILIAGVVGYFVVKGRRN